ncbi:hypothetical protein [Stenotrophomonas tumulicola]|uniref:Uncharacterized protein n=1 Tax=Stenotrophomonas tumulicola TaxID=1685415 RepID=A0A7W3FP07_9GAMM|nr:hypothetical protein [Stenotrophomonas tumulicola]MBA8683096.1 hypothetical protein [Stenotrophomonas tumulicola]
MEPISSPTPSTFAAARSASPAADTRTFPHSVVNTAPLVPVLQSDAATATDAQRFVDGVAAVCRKQGLASALVYLQGGQHHGDAIVADALQQLIAFLPSDRAWEHEVRATPAKVDLLAAKAAALRALLQQIENAISQGHGRDGMTGFATRAGRLLPMINAAEAAGNAEELGLEISTVMGWQGRAVGEVMDALATDAPVCCHALWARYALDQGDWRAEDNRQRIWTLLIAGKDNRFTHARRIQRADTFHGPVMDALRSDHRADNVIERFHITCPMLQRWAREAAEALHLHGRLDDRNRLPFHAGI